MVYQQNYNPSLKQSKLMNASEEKQESSQRDQFMGCMKIYWKIVRDGFPLALFAFLSMVPLVSLPIFGGHENIAVLNVIALYMATDFTFMSNVNFSCGFAFQGPIAMAVGARDSKRVRTLFQRAVVSGSIVYVCITVPTLIVSYWMFLLVKQPASIALDTTWCLVISAPAELLWVFIALATRTMIAQHIIWPVVGVGAVFAMFGVCGQMVAFKLNTEAMGLAASYTVASILTTVFVMILMLAYRSQRDLLLEWTRESFSELWELIWLFLKTVAYQFSMRLFVEVGTIFISLLGPDDLGAQFILLRYGIIVLVTGMGFWIASVALMGRAAGRGKREKFVSIFRANFSIFIAIAIIMFFLLCVLRYQLAYASTSLPKVQNILVGLTPFEAMYLAVMLLFIGSHSLLLSLGKVNVPTITTIVCEFIVGMPLAMVLTFGTSLRLYGFYIGLTVSYILKLCIIWTYYICFWNDILAPIDGSTNETASTSESSPFLQKAESVQNVEAPPSAAPNSAVNTYGTADPSSASDK